MFKYPERCGKLAATTTVVAKSIAIATEEKDKDNPDTVTA